MWFGINVVNLLLEFKWVKRKFWINFAFLKKDTCLMIECVGFLGRERERERETWRKSTKDNLAAQQDTGGGPHTDGSLVEADLKLINKLEPV